MQTEPVYTVVSTERDATHVRIPIQVWRLAFQMLSELSYAKVGATMNALLAGTQLLREERADAEDTTN